MVLLPNYTALLSVLLSPVVSIASKIAFFGTLYGTLGMNYTVVSSMTVILISLLFGINAALLVYYIRRAQGSVVTAARNTSASGVFAAFFGVGCGSAVVAVLFKLIGIGWIVTYLPLHGAEFGLIGVLLLVLVSYSLIKKINDPLTCEVHK